MSALPVHQPVDQQMPGFHYRLENIAVGDLLIDPIYQREQSLRHIDALKAEWNPLRLAPVVVSEREDGSKMVVEGGHRVIAAREMFGSSFEVPAQVWVGLTLSDEADAWGANTRRKATTGAQEHKAALVAGNDEIAQQIEVILKERGLRVGNPAFDSITGVKTLRKIIRDAGPENLALSIDTLDEAFGRYQDTWQAAAIEGLSVFYRRHGIVKARHHRIVRSVREAGIDGRDPSRVPSGRNLVNNAVVGSSNAAYGSFSAKRAQRVANFIETKYNFGLTPKHRLGGGE